MPVSHRDLRVAPQPRQGALVVGVDQVAVGCLQRGGGHVAAVGEPQRVRAGRAAQVLGGLGGAEVGAVGEGGEQVARDRPGELGLGA
jgi:hypothetical protein